MLKKADITDIDDPTNPSAKVLEYITDFEQNMDRLRVLKADGIPVIKLGLSKLTTHQLSQLEKIASMNGRNGVNEGRLYKMFDLLYPDLVEIDMNLGALKFAKSRVVIG